MPIAIGVSATNNSAEAIRALWTEVSRLEEHPSMATLGHPPHVTLAVYDDVAAERLKVVLDEVFAGAAAVRLTFNRLRFFDSVPLVLWAEPAPSQALVDAHAQVHARIDPAWCRPHYRPGAWNPHCTLGTDVQSARREEAKSFAGRRNVNLRDIVFDVADCVSFPPVAIVAEQQLARDFP